MKGVRDRVYTSWRAGKSPSPATETLGITIQKLGPGRAIMRMMVDERLHNLSGTMHGGIMSDIADAAMGIALATTLSPDEDFTTIEFKMSFLRPHVRGLLRAEGSLAKRGRRIAFTEAVLTNSKKEVVAKSSGTCLLMKR
jgi:uncharacterized protein (TIGR00369 family)